jgi:hypothetical protein
MHTYELDDDSMTREKNTIKQNLTNNKYETNILDRPGKPKTKIRDNNKTRNGQHTHTTGKKPNNSPDCSKTPQ